MQASNHKVHLPRAEANAARVAVRLLMERKRSEQASGEPDDPLLVAAYLGLCLALFRPSQLCGLFQREGFWPAIPPALPELPLPGFHPQTRRAASRLLLAGPFPRTRCLAAQETA